MPATQVVGFKRHLRAEVREGVGAFLFSELGVTAMRGAHIESVAEMLESTPELSQLLGSRPAGLEPDRVASVLDQLYAAGLVTVRSASEVDADARSLAFWDACGVMPAHARVGLLSVGSCCDLAATRTALEQAELTVANSPGTTPSAGTALSVVLCEDYLDPELAEVDVEHRAAGVPWLLAKPVGTQIWVGPVFGAGNCGCWHCLASRLWGHRQAESCVQRLLGHTGPAGRVSTSIPALAALAVNLISLEAAKWVAGHRYPGQQCVWTLDSLDLGGRRHELRRRPQCAACGDPTIMAVQSRAPVVLPPAKVVTCAGGGQRAETADRVLERYRHLISPVTGVLKEITRDPRGPGFLNAYLSGPNPAVRANGMSALGRVVRHHSGGKGVTPLDAEVAALCEALERYCGTFQGDEERITGSLRSIGARAIHPNDCMHYDQRQYETRAAWNRAHAPFQHVPEPFDEDADVDWTPVWSLTTQRQRLLPTAMLYYGIDGGGLCADSNGNAAGASLADAVLQGLLELVERDSVALWWYNRIQAPGIDLSAFGEPWLQDLRRRYAELGRELWALDLTSDLGIPVIAAVSQRVGGLREDISFGFGAHFDPHIALRRALTEQNQLMPALISMDADESDDPDASWWFRNATVLNQPYLLPDPAEPARVPAHFGYQPSDNLCESVESITSVLAHHGMETFVLNQTRPDVDLPVVKVIVPGLRHYWARFAPGRLFDVPVTLGRLAEPTRYEDLNPIPMFM